MIKRLAIEAAWTAYRAVIFAAIFCLVERFLNAR